MPSHLRILQSSRCHFSKYPNLHGVTFQNTIFFTVSHSRIHQSSRCHLPEYPNLPFHLHIVSPTSNHFDNTGYCNNLGSRGAALQLPFFWTVTLWRLVSSCRRQESITILRNVSSHLPINKACDYRRFDGSWSLLILIYGRSKMSTFTHFGYNTA